jgi:imidazolonepropionase
MRIANLAGVFTGSGFVEKRGRRPTAADCGFIQGPIDIISGADGRIAEVRPTSTRLATDAGEELDGSRLIATAGFVDSHTHAIHAGQRANEYFLRWSGATYREIAASGGGIHRTVSATTASSDADLYENLAGRLREMLLRGTTTAEVKSGYADSPYGELRLLSLIARAKRDARLPRVLSTFLALHAVPRGQASQEYCENMIDILGAIRAKRLADHVDSFPERGFFTLDESVRFATAARSLGFGLKVHADEITDMGASEAFIQLGSHSIDHLEKINDDAVHLLGQRDTVATLMPATSLYAGIEYASARRLIDAGAKVALATDFNPGTAPSPTLQLTQLLAASQLRMSAAEILCACTYNGAVALGLEREQGEIAQGLIADVLLWDVSSTRDSQKHASAIEEIIVGGLRPQHVLLRGSLINPAVS